MKNKNLDVAEIYNSAPEGADPAVWTFAHGVRNPAARVNAIASRAEYDMARQDHVHAINKIDARGDTGALSAEQRRYEDEVSSEQLAERKLTASEIRNHLGATEVRLKKGLGRRVAGSVAMLSAAMGVAVTLMIPPGPKSPHIEDDSIFPGNTTTDIIPEQFDRFTPPGLNDFGYLTTKVEVVPVDPAEYIEDQDAGLIAPVDIQETRYRIIVSSDSKVSSAANEYSSDFELTGTERAADDVAANEFIGEMLDVMSDGGIVEEIIVTGNASDEAAGEQTGIGESNPENLELAGKRASVGDASLQAEEERVGLEDVLPDAKIEQKENVLSGEEISTLDGYANDLGMTRKTLINRYLNGDLDLTDEQTQVMQELFTDNRGVTFEATVVFTSKIEDDNGPLTDTETHEVASPDGLSDASPQDSRAKTELITSDEVELFLSGNSEFTATVAAGIPFILGSILALAPGGRISNWRLRNRARRELKKQGFKLPKA